ncbi:MAG: hypothetical protein HQM12_16720 [SAR324 cluster bacterium]|nr:hypothetical protein [SAR324 cluster bacterium]
MKKLKKLKFIKLFFLYGGPVYMHWSTSLNFGLTGVFFDKSRIECDSPV